MEFDLTKTKIPNKDLVIELWKRMINPFLRKRLYATLGVCFLFDFCYSLFYKPGTKMVSIVFIITFLLIYVEICLKVLLFFRNQPWYHKFRKKRGIIDADKKLIMTESEIILDDVLSCTYNELRRYKITEIALLIRTRKYFIALPRDCFTNEELTAGKSLLQSKIKTKNGSRRLKSTR